MMTRTCLSIILAAGEGTRMKSAMSKVLHPIGGLPMIAHVTRAAVASGAGDIAIVAGRGAEEVTKAATPLVPSAETFIQNERLGTAHAVLAARAAIERGYDDILVLFGDTPLIDAETLAAARTELARGAAVAIIGFRTADPFGYGRLIEENGALLAIREERDCSDEEKNITFCNGGLMAIAGQYALGLLDAVGNDNARGEYYLTDIVATARAQGLVAVATEAAFESLLGVNDRSGLAKAEAIWQNRRRRELMAAGVTMIAPETVFLSFDTEIGPDTVLEPHVVFAPGVRIAGNAVIHSFSHLEGASVAAGCQVGPFARLRPGADLRDKAKVGNFCEVKKAVIDSGAKINHLTYIGDAFVGEGANIGAGTITCNYDGFNKFFTDIGAGAFIGSNTSLVAPLRVGGGSYIASGSVITQDVPDGALAFGRARQTTYADRGRELRIRLMEEKTRQNKAKGDK